jgi:hypothetical protein
MNNNTLGIITILLGILGLITKNAAVERRIRIYKKFGKIKSKSDYKSTKLYLNMIFSIVSIILILFGLWSFF